MTHLSPPLSPEHHEKVVGYYLGTANHIDPERFHQDFGFEATHDQILNVLSMYGVETCPHCGWWCASDEIVTDDYNRSICRDCIEESKEN